MNCRNKTKKILLALLLFGAFTLTPAALAATITTDQEDYAPWEIVTITGSGFEPYAPIALTIEWPDGFVDEFYGGFNVDGVFSWVSPTCPPDYFFGGADDSGGFTFVFGKEKYDGTYIVTATDAAGNTATKTFTDATSKTVSVTTTSGGSVDYSWVKSGSGGGSGSGTVGPSSTFSFDVLPGSSVTFTALPAGGYSFTGWSGDLSGTTSPQTIGASAALTVTASFTTVSKTDPTLSVTNSPQTYNGSPQAATVVGSVAGVVSDVKYDGSSTVPTDAGTYAVTADFAPTDTTLYNSLDDASAGDFVIEKADAIIVVTPYNVTYDGDPHTATGTATGINGEDLSAGLDLSGTTHTDAGSYAGDPWTFASANYNDAGGTVDDYIGKADAIILVTPYDVTYDGDPHTATGTATGVNGEDLSAGLDLSGTTHTDAGDYVGDSWTFTDVTGNYNDDSGIVDDYIDKADATIVVTPYDVTYDGAPHTATGTATGVKGEDLSAGLDLSGTTHTNAGFYAGDPWTFTDVTGNYNDDSGTVDDNIDKATTSLLLTVNPQLLLVGGAIDISAVLSSSDSPVDLSGMTIHFSIDSDPAGWPFDAATIGGGVVPNMNMSTTGWAGDVYTITATYDGDDNIAGCSDDATLVVAEPGAAATGGGFITDNGRTNFGFTVKMVEGTTNTYKGRFVIVNNGKWRMKGELDTYGTLSPAGYASGSGTLYQWDPIGIVWVEVASDVDILLSFTDTYNGSGTGNAKKTVVLDTLGLQIDFSSEDFDASNPNTGPMSLKGGNIDIKSANNTTDGDPATPPPTGKGKNK